MKATSRHVASLIPALLIAMLAACQSVAPVPVVNRQLVASVSSGPTHLVKKGDTLYSIALDNGLYYRDVQAWNNLDDPNVIQVGQQLRLTAPSDSRPSGVKVSPVTVPGNVQSQPIVEQRPLTPLPPAKQENKPVVAQPTPPVQATPASSASSAEPMLGWTWPSKGKVLAGFGDAGGGKGIDIAGNAGDPVMAVGEGKVVYVGSSLRGYGQMVIVKHDTYQTVYAHNRRILVTEGQTVRQGQRLAEMGDSDADRVKLHFEVRRQGKPVDPTLFLPTK